MDTVTLKLPEFWQANPTGWFCTVESQFLRDTTVDNTKFHLASLGLSTSAELKGFLANPLDNNKYDAIKAELLKIYQQSQSSKKCLLMNLSDLGDPKPSEPIHENPASGR